MFSVKTQANNAFSERHPGIAENASFLKKSSLFAYSFDGQPGVLSWKMMTRHHSKVHPTGGSRRVFRQFAWLEVDSGKVALFRPAHQRVTHTVGQLELL